MIRCALYPLVLFGAVLTAWWLQSALPVMGASLIVIASAGAVIWAAELALPYRRSWRPDRRKVLIDVIHTVVSSGLSPIFKAAVLFGVVILAEPEIGLDLWPRHWPLALQVLLAIPVADLGIYLGHRLMHVTDVGWRIHLVHHATDKLHFWASARSHPFNVAVKFFCETGVLLMLGVPTQTYALWLVFMTVNGMLQHANADLHPGWLSQVLATNVVHRAHHEVDLALSNANYGNTTVVWDRLFGTYRLPESPTTEVGAGGYDVPENYGVHLLLPFVSSRYETSEPLSRACDNTPSKPSATA